MAYYFKPTEITQLAVDVEESGYRFYRALSEWFTDFKTKSIFIDLANQELDHEKAFKKMGEESENAADESGYVINIGILLQTAIGELKEAFDLTKVQKEGFDIVKALDLGIAVEDESIRIYSEVKEKFISRFGPILQKIIDEEKNHRLILQELKEKI